MDASVKSLLYAEPRLYDLVFPDAAETELRMCLTAFAAPGRLAQREELPRGRFSPRVEVRVDVPGFSATSVSHLALDRAARRLTRRRVWQAPGAADVEDFAEYRLPQPDELRALAARAGFEVLALHDNREFRASDLTGAAAAPDVAGMRGRKLYLVARRSGG